MICYFCLHVKPLVTKESCALKSNAGQWRNDCVKYKINITTNTRDIIWVWSTKPTTALYFGDLTPAVNHLYITSVSFFCHSDPRTRGAQILHPEQTQHLVLFLYFPHWPIHRQTIQSLDLCMGEERIRTSEFLISEFNCNKHVTLKSKN